MDKTCKDCVCNELCTTIGFNNGFQGGEQCRHFKDKSLFIELPCKVGDRVYCESWIKGRIKSFNAPDTYWIIEKKELFGKELFLTREEAEQALKERKV